MYQIHVVRPASVPEVKGPPFKPFWETAMRWQLRTGFILQLIGFALILFSSVSGNKLLQIFQVLSGNSDSVKNCPVLLLTIGAALCTIGAVCVQNFRSMADDDASINQTRGFRAGIKALHQASLFGILSWAMTTFLMFSFIQYFEDESAAKRAASGSTAIYAAAAQTFHALSLVLYAAGFFMVECFHTRGTAEAWGWFLAIFYKAAGIFEILAILLGDTIYGAVCDAIFTVCLGFGLICAVLWAGLFEPMVESSDVDLTQSAMRNEHFKSEQATAYQEIN